MMHLLSDWPAIRPARLYEVGQVTATLAEAFQDGDLAGWLVPDEITRRKVYPEYFRIFAEFFVTHGAVQVTDDLAGVAVWWPVGDELVMDIPHYDERLALATGDAVGRFITLDMAMHSHHPHRRSHHYLAFLAVRPERQHEGLGGALLRHHHRQLDHDEIPAYLEATGSRNRRLYLRYGYRPTRALAIPAGPDLYPMWRPAQSVQRTSR
jgi:GNAT superfamily N-acetyltransferase